MNKIREMYKIADIVELILNFNNDDDDQEGKGLKILTPNQMLSRLPIYLFRSKKLTKQIYKSLIDII